MICEQCGKSFEAKRSTARFCSSKCRLRSHRGTVEMKTCLICGNEFPTDGKREYCCDECSEVSRRINQTHNNYKRYELYSNDDGSWED